MNSEEKNQDADTNDIAGNVGAQVPGANAGTRNPLANSATQPATPAMSLDAADGAAPAATPNTAEPQGLQMAASGQPLGASGRSEDPDANLADAAREPGRRGRKPGTPNKPKDGAPQSAAKVPDAKAGSTRRTRQPNGKPEASSDNRQPDTYGGNFGNGVQTSFQDQERYQNQLSGAGRGEFGAPGTQGGTQGGYGNQYRESDYDDRRSAEDRYYGGPGRYGPQHNAYRDYDGRDERGNQSYRGNSDGYYNPNNGRPASDNHGYDRHGFNDQGGHYYGPNEGYDPRHAGGYGYPNYDPRSNQPRPDDRGQGGNRSGDDYYQQGRPGGSRGYDDGRGNQRDNRNQPDRDDRRSGYQNDNGAAPGRPGTGYASDYGQSSFGGSGNDQRNDTRYGADRRNQDEDGRSSRGGYDNQGSGGGRAGHQHDDQGRYGQQGYQGSNGRGPDEPGRNRYQQGGPARDQQGDPRRQPTEGYGYGYGRDERSGQPDYRTGDQRNGYGRSFGGDSQQGYGSRGGSYNDEYDNANRGQGQQGSGSPAQGDYTRQDRALNYGPGAQQQFRADKPPGEQDAYGPAPRRNRGRDDKDQG